MKESMYNEYEALKPHVYVDFKKIEDILSAEIKELSTKYNLVEIEQYLVSTIVQECAEQRLRNSKVKG